MLMHWTIDRLVFLIVGKYILELNQLNIVDYVYHNLYITFSFSSPVIHYPPVLSLHI